MVTFVRPEADYQGAGYQITHSKIALGTGGWTGVGFGESREKRLGNLPAQRTDFIFAIVGEELGLVGSGTVLALFLLLAARGFHIAMRCTNRFGALLATGITGMVSVQALVNIGVVTASLPATGVPLPFLSYGGSSLVPTLFGIGILLNISQHPFYRERREKVDERAAAVAAAGRDRGRGGGRRRLHAPGSSAVERKRSRAVRAARRRCSAAPRPLLKPA
jgi:cell division protein FtsW (lipid II flippase)